jgi:hypothetical protein
MRCLKKRICILALAIFAANAAADVGIQSEIGTLSLADFLFAQTPNANPDDLGSKLGLRLFSDAPVGLDMLVGFGYRSEVPTVDSIGQDGQPKYFSIGTTIGLCARAHHSEKASLWILPRYTMTIVTNGEDTTGIFNYDSEYLYYSSVFHRLSLLFEPAVKLGDNVELFTNFGFSFRFIPNSKYYRINGWKERSDKAIQFGLSGILLGFRYNL